MWRGNYRLGGGQASLRTISVSCSARDLARLLPAAEVDDLAGIGLVLDPGGIPIEVLAKEDAFEVRVVTERAEVALRQLGQRGLRILESGDERLSAFGGGASAFEHPLGFDVLGSVAWCAVLVAVAAPLALRSYRKD